MCDTFLKRFSLFGLSLLLSTFFIFGLSTKKTSAYSTYPVQSCNLTTQQVIDLKNGAKAYNNNIDFTNTNAKWQISRQSSGTTIYIYYSSDSYATLKVLFNNATYYYHELTGLNGSEWKRLSYDTTSKAYSNFVVNANSGGLDLFNCIQEERGATYKNTVTLADLTPHYTEGAFIPSGTTTPTEPTPSTDMSFANKVSIVLAIFITGLIAWQFRFRMSD